jgi:hypothetical protein
MYFNHFQIYISTQYNEHSYKYYKSSYQGCIVLQACWGVYLDLRNVREEWHDVLTCVCVCCSATHFSCIDCVIVYVRMMYWNGFGKGGKSWPILNNEHSKHWLTTSELVHYVLVHSYLPSLILLEHIIYLVMLFLVSKCHIWDTLWNSECSFIRMMWESKEKKILE